MSTLAIILIVLLVLALFGGYWGTSAYPHYGYGVWSPVGIVLVILVLLFLTGRL
jgi:cytosine/uracil/thiamine/allantoin permease